MQDTRIHLYKIITAVEHKPIDRIRDYAVYSIPRPRLRRSAREIERTLAKKPSRKKRGTERETRREGGRVWNEYRKRGEETIVNFVLGGPGSAAGPVASPRRASHLGRTRGPSSVPSAVDVHDVVPPSPSRSPLRRRQRERGERPLLELYRSRYQPRVELTRERDGPPCSFVCL